MKEINKKIFFVLFLMYSISLRAQYNYSHDIDLVGNLKADSKTLLSTIMIENKKMSFVQVDKKSPLISGLLSLVVPGAGEIYSENYINAIIFAALEIGVITTAIVYDKKGDDKTTEFQNYADNVTDKTGWSVVRYAEYLNSKGASIPIDPNTNLKPWQRVNWDSLHKYETGSHHLEKHGEQQYYEMIGKYNYQFSSGWPDFTTPDVVPPMMQIYANMRGKANDYYNVATKAVIAIYINHFLSMLDAVWSAVSFNKDLQVSFRLENQILDHTVDYNPKVNFRLSL
jgi:hypothetical protein